MTGVDGATGADGAPRDEVTLGSSRALPARGAARPAARRGPADPVKALLHRHRELCARAVDPLEIAAGLEAHGVTDRTAARFRHRDVFSLAEELYARVPRTAADTSVAGAPAAGTPDPDTAGEGGLPGAMRALFLLPGAVCAVAVAGVRLLEPVGPVSRLGAGLLGAVAVAIALRVCLRRGPLSRRGRSGSGGALWTCWLGGHLLLGEAVLGRLAGDGTGGLWPGTAAAAAAVALTFAVLPAAECAHGFAVRARRKLAASRGLDDFRAGVRPLLPVTVGLFLGALLALLLLARAVLGAAGPAGGLAPAAALGVLVFVARLTTVHGRPSAGAAGLAAACAVEIVALGSVAAARIPGCAALSAPVEAAVRAYGPGVVPLTACSLAAAALLVHAAATLTRASAHSGTPGVPR
ncbi:hypothetical protein ACFYYR_29985 [Streptomyces sp. NPDC001922]|uniref:hypothetical protein n=1 Tax=Streptomyces sp. NPDC001922 TaxID=3364624 RepID=UPI003686EB3A